MSYSEPSASELEVRNFLETTETAQAEKIEFVGYRRSTVRLILFWLIVVVTLGVWWLLCYWLPKWKIWFCFTRAPFHSATHICSEKCESEITPIKHNDLVGRHFIWRHEQWRWVNYDEEIIEQSAVLNSKPNLKSRSAKQLALNDVEEVEIESEGGESPVIELSKGKSPSAPHLHSQFSKTRRAFRKRASEGSGFWVRSAFRIRTPYEELHSLKRDCAGLTRDTRFSVFGNNLIHIPVPNPIKLLIQEVLNPFYLFQVFSVLLWYYELYYSYATAIVIISTVSALWGTWETYQRIRDIRNMAHFSIPVVRINEKGERMNTNSSQLVPGDVIEITQGFTMPCDCVLLAGQCVMNEAMLTGESIPVVKNALPDSSDEVGGRYDPAEQSRYTLYGGTTVIKTVSSNPSAYSASASSSSPQSYQDSPSEHGSSSSSSSSHVASLGTLSPRTSPLIEAMVIKTGFSTAKGQLVRSILHPRPMNFKFYRDSLKFIAFLFLLCLAGFLYSLYFFIKYDVRVLDIFVRGGDLVTVAVPPALPIALTIGVAFAVQRLKKYRISCIAPSRVNLAGRVNVLCFDKTGTLTEEGLDVSSVQEASEGRFLQPKQQVETVTSDLIKVLGACHGLTDVDGALIGDPLEVKMFQATRWTMHEVNGGSKYNHLGVLTVVNNAPHYLDQKPPAGSNVIMEESYVPVPTNHKMGIIKRYDFTSALQRMSVIAVDLNAYNAEVERSEHNHKNHHSHPHHEDDGGNAVEVYGDDGGSSSGSVQCNSGGPEERVPIYILTKGAPEVISAMCDPATVPGDFESILTEYTRNGWRVLACAVSRVDRSVYSLADCKAFTRDEAERHRMEFVGLLVMENKLKPETKPTVLQLNSAKIVSIMVTGDNPLTAAYVAKTCHMIPPRSQILLAIVDEDNQKVLWHNTDNPRQQMFLPEVMQLVQHVDDVLGANSLELIEDGFGSSISFTKPITMAVTGKAFDLLMKEYNKGIFNPHDGTPLDEVLSSESRVAIRKDQSVIQWILTRARIYARMRPEQKQQLVESMMELPPNTFKFVQDGGLPPAWKWEVPVAGAKLKKPKTSLGGEGSVTVGFCGDGANDCGALKAADIGLSLSDAEASIAAPFTSKVQNISCMINMLREGRCALVTSFQAFKYMAAYSLIQFLACIILYVWAAILADNQFLWADLLIILPLAFAMCRTEAAKKLVPQRPTSSLLSIQVLLSLALQMTNHGIFQIGAYILLSQQSWYKECVPIPGDDNSFCVEVTVIFLISSFQYVATCWAYSISKPFRRPFYTNKLLTAFLIIFVLASSWIILYPKPQWLANFLVIQHLPQQFRYDLEIMALVDFVLAYLFERLLVWLAIEINFFQRLDPRPFIRKIRNKGEVEGEEGNIQ